MPKLEDKDYKTAPKSETEVFLTKTQLAKRWHVKTRTIELWVRADKCPKPFKPNYKTALWRLDDIIAHEKAIDARCGK